MSGIDDPIQIDASVGNDYLDVELQLDPLTVTIDATLDNIQLIDVDTTTITVDAHIGIPGATGPTGPDGGLSNEVLAANPDMIIAGIITRDANGAAIEAPVIWPDGDTGTYIGIPSLDFPGAIDAYSISSSTSIYSQPAVTRDDRGAVIFRPPIEVEDV